MPNDIFARNRIGAIIKLYLATDIKSGLIFLTCQDTVRAIINDPTPNKPIISGIFFLQKIE